MTEPDYDKLLAAILQILDGIDKTEQIEDASGWWETASGAEFGAQKLEEIKRLFDA